MKHISADMSPLIESVNNQNEDDFGISSFSNFFVETFLYSTHTLQSCLDASECYSAGSSSSSCTNILHEGHILNCVRLLCNLLVLQNIFWPEVILGTKAAEVQVV
jgi:hypothetical protein